jgi:hypothetical protein
MAPLSEGHVRLGWEESCGWHRCNYGLRDSGAVTVVTRGDHMELVDVTGVTRLTLGVVSRIMSDTRVGLSNA